MNKPIDVLIVDDEQLVRQGLRLTVNWQAYNMQVVGEAPNGESAWSIIRESRPELVITDIVMPKLDGIGLAQKIRTEFPDISVLFLSCHSDFSYAQTGLKLGVKGYVLKTAFHTDEMSEYLTQIKSDIQAARERAEKKSVAGSASQFEEKAAAEWTIEPDGVRCAALLPELETRLSFAADSWRFFFASSPDGIEPALAILGGQLHGGLMGRQRLLIPADLSFLLICAPAGESEYAESVLLRLKQSLPSFDWRSSKSAASAEKLMRELQRLVRLYRTEQRYSLHRGAHLEAVLDAIHFMEDHLHEDIDTSQIARHADMSRSHFSLIFKKVSGENLIDFIYKLRLERTFILLSTTDLKSSEISEKIGIRNYKYFSKWFKQTTGMTPSEYRSKQVLAPV